MIIGNIIRQAREKKVWTLKQLSLYSGVPVTTISSLERGTTKQPRVEAAKALERALGVSLTRQKKKDGNNLSADERFFLSKFKQLNKQQQQRTIADIEDKLK